MMNKLACLALAAVPVLVTPAAAQEQQISVEDYIKIQMALLNGMNELLSLESIADAPGEVAAGINRLTQYAAALVSYKGELNADALAAAQGNLEADPVAQSIGSAFIKAVNELADKNFYNSNELATAVQNFAAVLANM